VDNFFIKTFIISPSNYKKKEQKMFSKELGAKLDKYHLLKHPFYQIYWNEGKLTREIIKDYAEQYYQHVKAFPRYISATHSICEDLEKRRILLENLQDEENKDGDHPKLWKNFAKALGADEKEIEKVKLDWFTKDMIDNFFSQARKSYAEGLASLYTYERQIPEIAETKIQGLKKFYGVKSKEGLEFFVAHKSADVIHRAECEKLLDSLSKEEQKKAETASLLTARYLWNFLSGMTTKHKLQTIAA
jgi:Pyrroloquinoline quinone (Coenzyme PQQ) biosynthesis protein C